MNRLIIVGNGFDLAHKLDTRFTDFILWYLRCAFDSAQKNHAYKDILIELNWGGANLKIHNQHFQSIDDYIKYLYDKNGFIGTLIPDSKNKDQEELIYVSPFKSVSCTSKLLADIIKNVKDGRWVDIEMRYYRLLKKIVKENKNESNNKIAQLNTDLQFITKLLKEYLSSLLPTEKPIDSIKHKINKDFSSNDFLNGLISEQLGNEYEYPGSSDVSNIMFLNFNYTSTIVQYLEQYHNNITGDVFTPEVINIHGSLVDLNEHPMIFGFGDELDDDYKFLENSEFEGVFRHSKSIAYLNNSGYSSLVRFLDSDDYQVYIWGHSCGLSDRTLLNMIFEHDKCQSIKIFYHQKQDGTNNYQEITEEISRQFTIKNKMRNRVVNFKFSEPLI